MLRTSHKKNPKAGGRLLAYMAQKNGGSVQAISRNLNRPNTTTHGWPARAGDGPDRFHDIKRPELSRKPAGEQLAGLRRSHCGAAGPWL